MEEKLPFEKIKRKILVKKEATTSEEQGCIPEKRPVEELINYGIINLNKSPGPTSHQTSDYVKKILHIKKSGHSGTLDPKVTGVLPIATGNATRIVQTLLKAGKEYVCLMHIHSEISQSKIHKTAKELVGKIKQLPPIRSAVKRQLRQREIYYLNILEIEGRDVLFRIGCEAGTYIRKLVHDWGIKMGIHSHMVQLIRTKAGPFTDKNFVSLHDLKDSYELWKSKGNEKEIRKVILHVEAAVQHLPQIWVFDNAVDTLCHGASLSTPGISKLHNKIQKGDTAAIMSLKNELICLGTAKLNSEEMLQKTKGLAVKTTKVFMQRNTYTKWKKEEK